MATPNKLTSLLSFTLLTLLASSKAWALKLPVLKDATLIERSYCCSADAAGKNFGTADSVDVGTYHHSARALLAYDLRRLPADAVIAKAELVLASVSFVGPSSDIPADLSVALVQEDWDELAVTWQNAPQSEMLRNFAPAQKKRIRLDVTDSLIEALEAGLDQVSYELSTQGPVNMFIPSRESPTTPHASYIDVSFAE